jgi:hypothetical protein
MKVRPAPNARFDWAMSIASLWCSGGILLDAWFHFHNDVETFFEPAHALLYAGLLASYVIAGLQWRRAGGLPPGYGSTKLGLGVFLVGGILDMIKHTLFGFEQGFDALLSVTHLIIGAGIFLIVAGPIRAGILRRPQPTTLLAQMPMLFGMASMIELIHWGTQFIFLSEAERMNAPLDAALYPHDTFTLLTLLYDKEGIGLLAVIVQSLLLAGSLCYLARRIALAPGAATVLFIVSNLFIALAHSNYAGQLIAVVGASIAAGLVADAFRLSPTANVTRWRVATFAAPATYWIVLLGVLAATMGGLWWSPDVISGSIVIAGAIGVFVNLLCAPEQHSQEESKPAA